MNYVLMIGILLVILFLLIGLLFLLMYLKKRKKTNQIPEEVLNDFNKAETLLKESKGTLTPQQVLLELYKERNNPVFISPSIPIVESRPVQSVKVNKLLKLFKKKGG
jgi:hypothetical protein